MGMLSLNTALERYFEKLGLTEYSEEIKKRFNPQGEMIWLSDIPLAVSKIDGEYYVDEAGFNLFLDKLFPLQYPDPS
ncbi:MAG: hypothetical protein L0220_14185 [Acidobacteria bacterium]|nr:hypothetical protein [Acidobacteriota bacterium]